MREALGSIPSGSTFTRVNVLLINVSKLLAVGLQERQSNLACGPAVLRRTFQVTNTHWGDGFYKIFVDFICLFAVV